MVEQYRGAGFLEGYATYKEIYYAYVNYCGSLAMRGNPNVNAKVKNFQDEQLSWINQMYRNNPKDIYWQQVYGIRPALTQPSPNSSASCTAASSSAFTNKTGWTCTSASASSTT
jgi:hypothetical protein